MPSSSASTRTGNERSPVDVPTVREGIQTFLAHWPEYLMEAAGLGLFMISLGIFGTLLEYPGSPLRQLIEDPAARRVVMGIAIGTTIIGIIYSPWGKRSGAHINPAVTLTFFRLGKVAPWDATFYVMGQFVGALLGILLVRLALGMMFTDPPVDHVVTMPGPAGIAIAFIAEVAISFVLMLVILTATNHARLARYTGLLAGGLLAFYIAVEAPLSGMSANPARSAGSAIPAWELSFLWIYLAAPVVGMLLAAETYVRIQGIHRVKCAKLHHQNAKRCIFRCGYRDDGRASHVDSPRDAEAATSPTPKKR